MTALPERPGLLPARLIVAPTWRGEGGARHLTVVAVPLVLSAISAVINLFFDRYFLAKYDLELHMTASLAASMSWWTLQNFGLGLVGYVGIFVAQYVGANRPHRIGASLWQSLYLALAGGALNLALIPLWGPFFGWIHADTPQLARLEALYCETLSIGSVFLMTGTALSFFFTGRGKTRFVMVVSFITSGTNILLNSWLIFSPPSWLPFIQPGLSGAAWATNFSFLLGVVIYGAVAFAPRHEALYRTRSAWRLDMPLLRRLVRYGLPQGMHHIIEVGAWTFFFLMVGRVSIEALTASNIAFTLNIVLFVPMLGVAQALSILMGHFVGSGNPGLAEKSTFTALLITFVMMMAAAACYVFIPEVLIGLFISAEKTGLMIESVSEMAKLFLLFVAVYSIADVFGIIYASAIKGAGDTRFVMYTAVFASLFVLGIPCAVAAALDWPSWSMWSFAVGYVYFTAVLYMLRYRSGRWKAMSVIEPDVSHDDEEPGGEPADAVMA